MGRPHVAHLPGAVAIVRFQLCWAATVFRKDADTVEALLVKRRSMIY